MKWKIFFSALSLVAVTLAEELAEPIRLCVPESQKDGCLRMADDVDGVQCVNARDRVDCMRLVQKGDADVVNLDAQEIYVGGRYFDLSVVAYERVDGDPFRYESVVLVHPNTDISSLSDLRGKRSCHTGVGRNAGWHIPLATLLQRGIMTPDCRGELHTASGFFSSSCASGNWSPDPIVDKELKKRHPSLCAQCQHPEACSADDERYNGYEGAILCLLDDAGDVAFTSMTAVRQMVEKNSDTADQMRLLCLDGSTKSVQDEEPCVWGRRPSNAFLVSSAVASNEENSTRITQFLHSVFARYPAPHVRRPDWFHEAFISKKDVSSLGQPNDNQKSWEGYLGDFRYTIDKPIGSCEPATVKFCVTSDPGRRKCEDLSKVARARRLSPLLECVQTESKVSCMQALNESNADIFTLDGGEVYEGGRYFNLQPVAAELYKETAASYYAVAVVGANSSIAKIEDLSGRKSCHTGFGRTAGWVMPVGSLVRTQQIPPDACNVARNVADYFDGSCVPGANDPKLNPNTTRQDDLCRQCIGDENGENKCRPPRERYNGYSGAFRCLAEGSGDVAFVKHVTVPDYSDGSSDLLWARDLKASDFRLICAGNTVTDVNDYLDCNLGRVPSHQVMMGGSASTELRLNAARLLAGASRYFGPQSITFRLFGTYDHSTDLLFKDSTTKVRAVPLISTYKDVLGEEFFKAKEATDPKLCDS